jgi:hypothetical protein
VTSLRLRGSVFKEPLPRSGLHYPTVSLLVRVLLRNGCFCGSTVLAWGKCATTGLKSMVNIVSTKRNREKTNVAQGKKRVTEERGWTSCHL